MRSNVHSGVAFGRALIVAAVAVVASAFASGHAAAQSDPIAAFYRGKEMRLLIGTPVAGGYDTYGRFFARHLPRFMPGAPSVLVQNVPGAAGVNMANSLYVQQPKDGTVIGSGAGSIATAALFGGQGARYDARRFLWIGSLNAEVGLVISWRDSPVRTAKDLFDRELIVGGSGATDGNVIFPNTMNNVLGTKFRVVPGYKGTATIAVAMEQGEVQGMGSWHYSSIITSKPEWLKDGSIHVLVQLALQRHPAIPDVPTVLELARTDEERAVIELVFAQQDMGRPFFAPPGIPPERGAALRAAFLAMVNDPEVLKEADRMQLEINQPMPGEAMNALIERLHAQPGSIIRRAADAITRAGG
ncbi:MAG: Bug family tripartite tricarboxylate transporter substrate binding protein [Gemmatimonas sp.]